MESTDIHKINNYLGSERYASLICADGKGGSFYGQNGLGFFVNAQSAESNTGKCIYIRDNDAGDFWINTANYSHENLGSQNSFCKHHSNFTEIFTEHSEIESTTSIFVPKGYNCEVWHLQIKNRSKSKRSLSLFSFVEYAKKTSDFDLIVWGEHIGVDLNHGGLKYLYKRIPTNPSSKFYLYEDVSIFNAFTGGEIVGYETNLERFIGKGRTFENPIAIEKGECRKQNHSINDNCSVIQLNATLEINETKDFYMILGIESDNHPTSQLIANLCNKEAIKRELDILENNKTCITNAVRII